MKTGVIFIFLIPVFAVFLIISCNPFYPVFTPVENKEPWHDYFGKWRCDEKNMEILTIAKNSVIQETDTGFSVEFIIDSWVKVNFYIEGYYSFYREDFYDYDPDGFILTAEGTNSDPDEIVIFLKKDKSGAVIRINYQYSVYNKMP